MVRGDRLADELAHPAALLVKAQARAAVGLAGGVLLFVVVMHAV